MRIPAAINMPEFLRLIARLMIQRRMYARRYRVARWALKRANRLKDKKARSFHKSRIFDLMNKFRSLCK